MKSRDKNKVLYRDELKKLLIIYSTSFIVASIILMAAFIQIYSNRVVRMNNNKASESTVNEISIELDAYKEAILKFEDNKVFQEYIKVKNNESEVYRILYDFINERKVKSVFYFVDTKGETLLTNNFVESPYNSKNIFLSGLFKQLSNKPEEVVYLINKVQIDLTKRTVYSIGKSIIINGEIVGYLIFDILESDLSKIIYKNNADIVVLTDQYNNVVTSSNTLVIDELGKFNLTRYNDDQILLNDNSYFYVKAKVEDGQLQLITLSELEIVSELMSKSLLFMAILFVLFTVIAVVIADILSKKKTEAIQNLITAIGKVQNGNLEAYVKIGRTDEFKFIGEQFNKMLVDVNRLVAKNSELIDRNRISEIKQLESQFNPHFIFNTLETLKYMMHLDADKASEIIMNFAVILRYSIDYDKEDIRLDQDLDYLKSYLLIQKYRYNKRLSYTFEIEEEAKECIVPKLIMQPIIENCINHGYKKKDALHIELSIKISQGELVAIIQDNGDGMDRDKLGELKLALEDTTLGSGHIGLNNVNRRIKLTYGEQYGLDISSVNNKGTKVMIRMPVVGGDIIV